MRLLHTSDWHLGRSFHREGLLGHQAAYVDHLLEVVEAEQVDLVVVAGDVYDRALPPVDAVELADEALARLAASRARVVVSSGNHDSARRLGFSSRLIDAAGVHLRTLPTDVGRAVVVPDAHGDVVVHALPYLDPDAVREPWGLSVRSHEAALGAAMGRVRADLATRPGARSVVLAHAFVAGGQPSESERDIAVGGSRGCPRPSSTASTTSPWATSTALTCSTSGCATPAPRWPTRSPRAPRRRAPGSWTWAPPA